MESIPLFDLISGFIRILTYLLSTYKMKALPVQLSVSPKQHQDAITKVG